VTRAVLLCGVALAVACSTEEPQPCPGQVVGVFTFGPATLTTTALVEGLDPQPLLSDCPSALRFPATLPRFRGTLAADPAPGARGGALCRADGPHLLGTHEAERFDVATSSGGAVLQACGSTCATTSRLVIRGDVLPDLASPQEFRGALVEQLSASEGCGACALPCAARYVLEGTAEPP
jgi:hypothetical protein